MEKIIRQDKTRQRKQIFSAAGKEDLFKNKRKNVCTVVTRDGILRHQFDKRLESFAPCCLSTS